LKAVICRPCGRLSANKKEGENASNGNKICIYTETYQHGYSMRQFG